jgi:predicted nucleic acid-binding protein
VASASERSYETQRTGQRPRWRAAALIAYFDTSALIKTLLEEDGSPLADEVWSRSSLRIASCLVYPEARAALAAAERGDRIDERSRRLAVDDLDSACAAMVLIGVDWVLAQRAGEIAERHALRGYDAMHLAAALDSNAADLVLVTWDRDLARAASDVGVAVVPG